MSYSDGTPAVTYCYDGATDGDYSGMITDKLIAERISGLMLDIGRQLDDSLHSVQTEATVDDFIAYREIVGRIMGLILTELLNPLYAAHPSIKPPELE